MVSTLGTPIVHLTGAQLCGITGQVQNDTQDPGLVHSYAQRSCVLTLVASKHHALLCSIASKENGVGTKDLPQEPVFFSQEKILPRCNPADCSFFSPPETGSHSHTWLQGMFGKQTFDKVEKNNHGRTGPLTPHSLELGHHTPIHVGFC